MFSKITILVEHGETTDPLDEFLDAAGISENHRLNIEGFTLVDYTLDVDIQVPPMKDSQ